MSFNWNTIKVGNVNYKWIFRDDDDYQDVAVVDSKNIMIAYMGQHKCFGNISLNENGIINKNKLIEYIKESL